MSQEPPLPAVTRQLIAAYEKEHHGLPERERAKRESAIWDSIPESSRVVYLRSTGRKALRGPEAVGLLIAQFAPFAGSIFAIRNRRVLALGGDLADVLWARVDTKVETMPLSTAVKRWEVAKTIAATGKSMAEALAQSLREYGELPKMFKADGTVVHRATTNPVERAIREAKAPPTEKKRGRKKKSGAVDVIGDLRTTVMNYLVEKATGAGVSLDSSIVADAMRSADVDISVLRQSVRKLGERIVESARSEGAAEEIISTRRVNAAFRTLNLEPPDGPVDMNLVRRHKKSLAREYHTDFHGGRPETAEKFNRVMEAWKVIESWVAADPSRAMREKVAR